MVVTVFVGKPQLYVGHVIECSDEIHWIDGLVVQVVVQVVPVVAIELIRHK